MSVAKLRRAWAQLKGGEPFRDLEAASLALASKAGSASDHPSALFGGCDEASWLWMNTAGRRKHKIFRSLLPSLPDEQIQERFSGAVGDRTLTAAFQFYQFVKQAAEKYSSPAIRGQRILDFGCGWGRVTRFFLKETTEIWGVDCIPYLVDVCEQTNKWGRFKLAQTHPPIDFPDSAFDLVYSYSVFSHLSESLHEEWLAEFNRLLKPGGLFIATTRAREFIQNSSFLSRQVESSNHTQKLSELFATPGKILAAYDLGQYCHLPIAGGDNLDASFYGETLIPKRYVLKHWTRYFDFIDYLDDRALDPQNIVVVSKPR